MGARLEAFYKPCCSSPSVKLNSGNFKNPGQIIEDAEKAELISEKMFLHTHKHLNGQVNSVINPSYKNKENELSRKLRQNASRFSAFKSAVVTEQIKKLKDEEERTKALLAHERQLVTEGNLATRTARAAKQWVDIERTKEIYPNLEYMPSTSADKRSEHRKLYGTILPIDHPFWDSYYPPNDWECKCRVRKTDRPVTADNVTVDVPSGVVGNAGKKGVVFSPTHPVFQTYTDKGIKKVERKFEAMKLNIEYDKPSFKHKNGSSVSVHLFAHENDLVSNYETAKLVAKQVPKTKIKIRPHVDNIETGIGKKGNSNPEYLINGKYGDLKTISGTSIKSAYKSAKRQGNKVVVFKIESDLPLRRAFEQIKGEIDAGINPFEKIFVIKDGKVHKY